MVVTRSKSNMEGYIDLIDKKLNDLRVFLLSELSDIKKSLNGVIVDKKEEIKSIVSEEISESVQVIKAHVAKLRAENILLKNQLEDLQQYTRRQNVRIFGIPVENNESTEACTKIVSDLLVSNDISLHSMDRCHRVGKKKKSTNSESFTQPIIVRFGTFRDRTSFYKKRKAIKDKNKCSISLDLTRERLDLLKSAREMVENVDDIKFVYSDINCQLRAFTSSKKHLAFDNIADLQIIITNLSPSTTDPYEF